MVGLVPDLAQDLSAVRQDYHLAGTAHEGSDLLSCHEGPMFIEAGHGVIDNDSLGGERLVLVK